jgi:hypothetical protein
VRVTSNTTNHGLAYSVRSGSRCALRPRYVDLDVSIDGRGHHFQHILQVHSDFPTPDLQKVFANESNGFRPV